jgi:hemoglobin/transferrin/lactoferrin receptor protein
MTQPDAIWVTAHVGDPLPSDYKDSDVTAGIGVLYKINETATMFASFSEGFRAPSADNVNSGFTNAPGNYKVLGNPNLTSESSEGIEAGLRLAFEYASIELSIFHNEYEDFIEENVIAPQFLATRGVDPSDGYLTFTTINRGQVEIEGAELAIQFDFAALGNGWIEDISLEFAVAYADGTDEVANEPLDSIEPLNGAIGISYDAASGIWGGELSLVFAEGKSPGDIASTTRYEAAGYGQLDLLGYYNFGERVDLSLGLFNLTDKAYVRWSDGIAIGSSDAPLRFSQPGFHAGLNLRITL